MNHFISSILYLTILAFPLLSAGCATKNEKGLTADSTAWLIIQRDQDVCLDVQSGKMWQMGRGGMFSSFAQAKRYAENLELAGHDDWRLPATRELFDLHYTLHRNKSGECNLRTSGDYWAVDNGKPKLGRWETNLLCAPNFRFVESSGTTGYVRAVRD